MLTVYTKTTCPYCVKAKNYLKAKKIDFTEINIESDNSARDFLKFQGHATVPQIYQNGKLFVEGGCDGLIRLSPPELMRRLNC